MCVRLCFSFFSYRRVIVVSGQATTIGGAAAVAAAVAAQKFERSCSVRKDLALDLPPCLALPDGEERPYGAANRMRIRHYDQVCLLSNFSYKEVVFIFIVVCSGKRNLKRMYSTSTKSDCAEASAK